MLAMTVILRFEDGTEIPLIGPAVELPQAEIENAYFSEPHEMPDMMLSDISDLKYEAITSH